MSGVVKKDEPEEPCEEPEQNKVSDVGKNLILDAWTADREGTLPDLGRSLSTSYTTFQF